MNTMYTKFLIKNLDKLRRLKRELRKARKNGCSCYRGICGACLAADLLGLPAPPPVRRVKR